MGGMKITNLSEVLAGFRLTDEYVTEGTKKAFREGAEKVKQLARRYAPVDEHRIEKAIKVLSERGDRSSLSLTVAVTGVVDGRSVDTYAAIVHEYQWHKRGPLTRMKGPQAGPRYLARAVRDLKKEIIADLNAAMENGVAHAARRSGATRTKRR